MYFDKEINDLGWLQVINELSEERVEDINVFSKGMATYMDTKFATGILTKLGLPVNDEAIRKVWTRKEEIYISLAKERKMFSLVPGLPEFLDRLQEEKIPFNISSLAPLMNFRFYFEYLDLGRWFDLDKIIYDDCVSYSNKVEMYRKSAGKIGLQMKDCLVFEDSDTGVQDAKEAGCRMAIQVYRKDHKPIQDEIVIKRIDDFRELNDDWDAFRADQIEEIIE